MSLSAEDREHDAMQREGAAYHDGYVEGHQDGFHEGNQKGFRDGYEQALLDQRRIRNGWRWVLNLPG